MKNKRLVKYKTEQLKLCQIKLKIQVRAKLTNDQCNELWDCNEQLNVHVIKGHKKRQRQGRQKKILRNHGQKCYNCDEDKQLRLMQLNPRMRKVYERTSLNELHKTTRKDPLSSGSFLAQLDIKNSLRNGYITKMTTELLHNLKTQ